MGKDVMGNNEPIGPYTQPELKEGYLKNKKKPEPSDGLNLKPFYVDALKKATTDQKIQLSDSQQKIQNLLNQHYNLDKLTPETEEEKKKIGQFDGVEIDGKNLDAEGYKNITAKQLNNLSRDQAFQVLQPGDDRHDPKTMKKGDEFVIQYPNNGAYLNSTAVKLPKNFASVFDGDVEYFRSKEEGKEGYSEFISKDGDRLVLGHSDGTPHKLKLGSTTSSDDIKKIDAAVIKRTNDFVSSLGLDKSKPEDKKKIDLISGSFDRGLSVEEVKLILNKDEAGIKKLGKEAQLRFKKNRMYLEQKGLVSKDEKKEATKDEDKKSKTFKEFMEGAVEDSSIEKKDFTLGGKKQEALYFRKGSSELGEVVKGLNSFTMNIPKEAEGKTTYSSVSVIKKGESYVYEDGDEKGKEVPKKVIKGTYITSKEKK